jgi:hypothetical protein
LSDIGELLIVFTLYLINRKWAKSALTRCGDTSMALLFAFESFKTLVETVKALAELGKVSSSSKKEGLAQISSDLRVQAVSMGKALEASLDQLTRQVSELGGLEMRLADADQVLARMDLVQRFRWRRIFSRITTLTTSVREYYQDVEAIFSCAGETEGLSAGVSRAHEVSRSMGGILTEDLPISDVITKLREPLQEAMDELAR